MSLYFTLQYFFFNLKAQNGKAVSLQTSALASVHFFSCWTLLTLDYVLFGPIHEDKAETLDWASQVIYGWEQKDKGFFPKCKTNRMFLLIADEFC